MVLKICIKETQPAPDHTEYLEPTENGDSSASEPKFDVDYGKFYKQSYLEMGGPQYKKGPPLAPSSHSPTHLHRPANFSYQHVKRDFFKPTKKGMLTALGDTTNLQKEKVDRELVGPISRQEAIRLARFPEGKRSEAKVLPIEKLDWPAPPSAAAAYPELLRDKKSREADEDEQEEEAQDPDTQKNIEQLEKLGDSGVGKALLKDYEKKHAEPVVIDPVSYSRTPAANKEPPYKTRYESHVDASPSRLLDLRARTQSMDDNLMDRKYRSQTLPVGNFPVERRRYERSISHCPVKHERVPKPGYSLGPKSATLPVSDSEAYRYDMEDSLQNSHDRRGSGPELRTHSSRYTSQSSIEEYDPETGLRKSRLRGSSTDGFNSSYLAFRRSVPSLFKMEEPPKIYAYEELKLSNQDRPPGTDRNTLERHLDRHEFEEIFNMTREQFYRLPEWKQNDLKRRVELF